MVPGYLSRRFRLHFKRDFVCMLGVFSELFSMIFLSCSSGVLDMGDV